MEVENILINAYQEMKMKYFKSSFKMIESTFHMVSFQIGKYKQRIQLKYWVLQLSNCVF